MFTAVHVAVSSSFVARRHALLTLNCLRTAAYKFLYYLCYLFLRFGKCHGHYSIDPLIHKISESGDAEIYSLIPHQIEVMGFGL